MGTMHLFGLNLDKPCGVSASLMELMERQNSTMQRADVLIWAARLFFFLNILTRMPSQSWYTVDVPDP